MSNQLEVQRARFVHELVESKQESVARSLSPKINSQRFMLAAKRELASVNFTAKQVEASKESAMNAMLSAAAFGLMPGVHCHFVPYKGQYKMLPNYKGVIHRANTSKRLKMHAPVVVFEGDKFSPPSRRIENGKHIVSFYHEQRFETEKVVGAYVIFEVDGEPNVNWVPKSYIDKVKSMAGNSDAWKSHYAEMARKTAVHNAAKYLAWDDGFDVEVDLSAAAAHDAGLPLNMGGAEVVKQPSSKAKAPEVIETKQKSKRTSRKREPEPAEDPPAPDEPAPDQSGDQDFDDGDFGGDQDDAQGDGAEDEYTV